MKKSIFGNMGKLSISFFRSRQTGSLMTRVMSDADRVTGFFIDGCPYIFINGLTIIVSLCFMFSIKWQMTLMVLVVMPFVMLIGLKLRPRIWTQFGHRHRAERAVNSQVNDNLTGARVVKAFGQENRETKRFEKNNLRLRDAEMSIVGTQNLVRGSYSGIFEILNISVWLIGVYLVIECEIPGLTQKFEQKFSLTSHTTPIYIKPSALTGSLNLSNASDSNIKITVKDRGVLVHLCVYIFDIAGFNYLFVDEMSFEGP